LVALTSSTPRSDWLTRSGASFVPRRFYDAQDSVSDFLRVARSAGEKRGHFGGNLVGNTVGLAARFVGSVNEIAKNRCLVSAGFDDDGFNPRAASS